MNTKKEQIKMKIFLISYIIFAALGFVGLFMVITKKLDNAGYAVIPMLFAVISSMLYRSSKKMLDKNKK